MKNLLKRIHARTLETVAPKGSGQGSGSWGYGCRHVKNGHVCRRDEADTHRLHSCKCGLIAWAT